VYVGEMGGFLLTGIVGEGWGLNCERGSGLSGLSGLINCSFGKKFFLGVE
jgi:hypothetical protein